MIVDTHNDLLTELEFFRGEEAPFEARWLRQLRDGGVGLQVCPIFVDRERLPDGALRQALLQAVAFHRALRQSGSVFVASRADLDRLDQAGGVGLMLSMEGAEPLGANPELLEVFWQLGLRMISLTWNDRNHFADGAGEAGSGGISRLGRELVATVARLGMMLDLAHTSSSTFWDALELAPDGCTVMVSHASCRAVYETPRNLADDQLRALADRGGVLGVMAHPLVVDPARPTLDRFIDHIDHAIDVMGVEHVGLGSDFIHQVATSGAIPHPGNALLPAGMKLSDAIEDFVGPADYPHLQDRMRDRGYTESDIAAISGGNFLRLFQRALPA